jgi:hypothetical protein
MEEVVAERIAPRLTCEWEVSSVVVAHHQSLRVADCCKPVHFSAVNLHLLLIVAVNEVGGIRPDRDVLLDAERGIGEVARE